LADGAPTNTHRRFASLPTAVLDCAHGYQKENQQEVIKVKENRRQKIFGETASAEAERT